MIASPTLASLVLSGCRLLREPSIECPCLEEAELHSCRELQPGALARLAAASPRLATLDLAGCARLPSIDLRAPSLRDLTLDGCVQLTRADVAAPNLQRLAMRGCVGCSPAVLDAIARGCPRLRAVDLRGCPLLVDPPLLAHPRRAADGAALDACSLYWKPRPPLAAAIAPSGGSSYEGGATGCACGDADGDGRAPSVASATSVASSSAASVASTASTATASGGGGGGGGGPPRTNARGGGDAPPSSSSSAASERVLSSGHASPLSPTACLCAILPSTIPTGALRLSSIQLDETSDAADAGGTGDAGDAGASDAAAAAAAAGAAAVLDCDV